MRETQEPTETEPQQAGARPAGGPAASSHLRQSATRPPLRHAPIRRSRRERAILWSAGVCAVLGGLVVAASLFGRLFLVQNTGGALATPTSPASVGISMPNTAYPPQKHPEIGEAEQALDDYIAQMSLDDELGQMIQVQFVGPNLGPELTIPDAWRSELRRVHVGSIILYWYNIQDRDQLRALDADLQSTSVAPNIPLIISTDEEGGQVDYLSKLYGGGPTEASLGASGDPQKAYTWGYSDGQHLLSEGINADLAPVVDVKSVPNPSISQRMYGSDPALVTTMASAFIDGLHQAGVMDCIKHWPGIGWSSVDAHQALPVSNRSRADLERIDFAPYRALLASGRVDMVMPTHVLLTQIDPTLPSSLSPIIVDGILRHEMGYQGVVITDALYMGAIRSKYSLGEAAVLAVLAGNDILSNFYDPYSVEQVMTALHQAIASGRISKARIDLSVKRILQLKLKYGLFTLPNS